MASTGRCGKSISPRVKTGTRRSTSCSSATWATRPTAKPTWSWPAAYVTKPCCANAGSRAPYGSRRCSSAAPGLLATLPEDDYTRLLQREFDYLSRKYDIDPLESDRWQMRGIRPANRPTLRLAQLAAFLSRHEFVIERVIECRSGADVYRLFGVEAPQYWSSPCRTEDPASERPRRVGHFKSDILAINLVAILQFAYGTYTAQDGLLARAVALLESIPAEDNRYMRRWSDYGLRPANAFESQALLQLAAVYCASSRCTECPVGRRIVQELCGREE